MFLGWDSNPGRTYVIGLRDRTNRHYGDRGKCQNSKISPANLPRESTPILMSSLETCSATASTEKSRTSLAKIIL